MEKINLLIKDEQLFILEKSISFLNEKIFGLLPNHQKMSCTVIEKSEGTSIVRITAIDARAFYELGRAHLSHMLSESKIIYLKDSEGTKVFIQKTKTPTT